MTCGLAFEILYYDIDLLEVRVRGSNGRFAGTADIYIDHDGLHKMADAIRKFPTSRQDRREFILGAFDPQYAGGGFRMQLRCTDASAHAVMEVQLTTDPLRDPPRTTGVTSEPESVRFFLAVEAAAIDKFVAEIEKIFPVGKNMQPRIGAVASLSVDEPDGA